ncbi:hypothetical protein TNCV_3957451 [Trichonephila clavipes]|nr:hypothetical protein TNCV_3957451 [Trichonephila clavipes]
MFFQKTRHIEIAGRHARAAERMVKLLPFELWQFRVCDPEVCERTLSWSRITLSVVMNSGRFKTFRCQKSDNVSLLLSLRILQCGFHHVLTHTLLHPSVPSVQILGVWLTKRASIPYPESRCGTTLFISC